MFDTDAENYAFVWGLFAGMAFVFGVVVISLVLK